MCISLVVVILMLRIYFIDAGLEVSHEYNYSATTECVKHILIDTSYQKPFLTFVNFNARSTDVLKTIHSLTCVSIVNRRPYTKIILPNKRYLIYAITAEDFQSHFSYLVAEASWMPYAPFVVVVESLVVDELHGIFGQLLRHHVTDVIVFDALTTNAYTYDPYENSGCGKRFDRIIPLGKCLTDIHYYHNLIQNKFKNFLQNCTIRVAATHWPPYTVDPNKTDINTQGMDEYVFSLLGRLEDININVTYFEDLSDKVSLVTEDMLARGPLHWLQENKFDALAGGFMLMPTRAAAFTYLYGHFAYDDHFKVFVRQADDVPTWKMFLLVFRPLVWLLLFLSFITIAILIIIIGRPKDRSQIIFNLIDNILMHTCRIRRTNRLVDFVLIFWIIFACLISYHYLSVLCSITTKPIHDYQIGHLSELNKFGIKPCVSDAVCAVQMQTQISEPHMSCTEANDGAKGLMCKTLSKTLETVSKSQDLFTVAPYCLYYANRYKYYDKYGKNQLYSFRKPLGKILYASYMYKGFPLYDRFHLLTMQVNAAGLTGKIWRDYDYFQKKRFQMQRLRKKPTVKIPWYFIIVGWCSSTLCFLGEILTNNYCRTNSIPNI